MTSFSRRRAFTLVELLVVIAIIGILVALLLPAVQAAREAGRRTTCKNHLKQIGLAVQNHHDVLKALPGGGGAYSVARTITGSMPANYTTQAWSWGYQILPYMEQEPLWSNPVDATVAGTAIATYYCPSRRPKKTLSGGGPPWQVWSVPRGMTDYAGNAGFTTAGGNGGGHYGDGRDGVITQLASGVILSLAELTDGTSSTMLVGEKSLDPSKASFAFRYDDNDGYVGGFQDDVVRWGAWAPVPDTERKRLMDASPNAVGPHIWKFGSSHVGGIHVVMCDGSVRNITYNVDLNVFRRVCVRDDGEVVNLPD